MSASEYGALKAPASLKRFPGDLLDNAGLQYSGIYEDGWVDKHCWVALSTSTNDGVLLEGSVPKLPQMESGNDLTVSIGDVPVRQAHLSSGEFAIFVPLPPHEAGTIKISLDWQRSVIPGSGEDRPFSAKIDRIELVKSK